MMTLRAYFEVDSPTHIIRMVLRATDPHGTNDFVDGTDHFMNVDEEPNSRIRVGARRAALLPSTIMFPR